jgi:uncharacterized protein YeaO (DUF488 family)
MSTPGLCAKLFVPTKVSIPKTAHAANFCMQTFIAFPMFCVASAVNCGRPRFDPTAGEARQFSDGARAMERKMAKGRSQPSVAWHRKRASRAPRQTTSIALKRVYDPASSGDGTRILVDRLWPRGISKEKVRIDLWLKDVSASDTLRKRFHGKLDNWDAFRAAYSSELERNTAQAAAMELLERIKNGPVTLLYAARNEQHNNAVALKLWLERRMTLK